MTALKVWNGTSWVTLPALQGPVGPVGPQGPPGVPVDFQRMACTPNAYRSASFAGTTTWHTLEQTAVLGAPYMQITYTSAVPFWWEIHHTNAVIRKDDAAYHQIYSGFQLSQPDLDGANTQIGIFMGHSTVMLFGTVTTHKTFRCAAGTWTVSAIMGAGSGGTWNYMKSPSTVLEARAWPL